MFELLLLLFMPSEIEPTKLGMKYLLKEQFSMRDISSFLHYVGMCTYIHCWEYNRKKLGKNAKLNYMQWIRGNKVMMNFLLWGVS